MGLQLESKLLDTQNGSCKDLAEQKDSYESRVDELRWRIIGLEREKLALQDQLAAPPAPPPKSAPVPPRQLQQQEDKDELIRIENRYNRRVLEMEDAMYQRDAHNNQTIQSVSGALRSTMQDQKAERAQHKERVTALEKSLTDREGEVANANKLLARQEKGVVQRDRDSEEARHLARKELEAQEVLFEKRVEELVRTHAKQDEFYVAKVASLEAQLRDQKFLNPLKRMTATATQRNPNSGANIILSRGAEREHHAAQNSLAETRLRELRKEQAASQETAFKQKEKEKEFKAQKLQMEQRMAVLEATLAKKDLDLERAKEDTRHHHDARHSERVRNLEQALAEEKDRAQRQIQGLQRDLARAQQQPQEKSSSKKAEFLRANREVLVKGRSSTDSIRCHQRELKSKRRIGGLERELRYFRAREEEGVADIRRDLEAAVSVSVSHTTNSIQIAPIPVCCPFLFFLLLLFFYYILYIYIFSFLSFGAFLCFFLSFSFSFQSQTNPGNPGFRRRNGVSRYCAFSPPFHPSRVPYLPCCIPLTPPCCVVEASLP
jgi:hypothetical protein